MSDLRELLERAVGDFEPRPAGLKRTSRRLNAYRRRRRLTAGVLASILAIASTTLVVFAFRGPSRAPERPTQSTTAWVTHDLANQGISIQTPPEWSFLANPVPAIVEPQALFAIATYPIAVERQECQPYTAAMDLPTDGMLLWIEEYSGNSGGGNFGKNQFPPRPQTFDLGPNLGPFECLGGQAHMVLFQDQGRYFQVFGMFGKQAPQSLHDETVQALDSIVTKATGGTPVGEAVYLPPFLQGGPTWYTQESPPAPKGSAVVAWASTVPLVDDLAARSPAIPIHTIVSLSPDDIVVTALSTPWSLDPADGPFPYHDQALDLESVPVRGPENEEPPGNYSVIEINSKDVLVRVYFGSATPSSALIEAAQREIDTLQLPPVCPTPAQGGHQAMLSQQSGSPGDVLSVSGPIPFQRGDGSYDKAGEVMVVWWNADPSNWASPSSSSTVSPSPALEGSAVDRLGEGGKGACSYSIAFAVPQVPPGDYPIVVVEESGGGSTLLSSLVLHVAERT